MVVFLVSE